MPEQELKIATWNVMRPSSSSKRNVSILGALEDVDADILILTETNSCIDLSKKYKTCFSTTSLFQSLSIGTGQYGHGENRVSIWSKFSGQIRSDMCNSHSGICALLKCDGWGELNIYGTILGIYGKNRGRYEPVLPRTDFQTAVEVQIIDWERLAGLGNLCIAGDFNTELSLDGSYYVSKLGREKINDCFERLKVKVPTCDIPNNIDHIALSSSFLKGISSSWETWNKVKDKKQFSDHIGVCLTLRRANSGSAPL